MNEILESVRDEHLTLLDNYLDNLARLNKSVHTTKNYRADLLKFLLWIEHKENLKLDRSTGEIISRYKEFLSSGGQIHDQNSIKKSQKIIGWFKRLIKRVDGPSNLLLLEQNSLSVSSRRRHLSSIKNFFEYLKETHEDHSKKFNINPVKNKIHAIKLKDVDVMPTQMVSKEEFQKIEDKTYRTRERLMLYLLYYGGLRLSELSYLKISNFDRTQKVITFIRKGGYIHTLAIQKSDLIFKNFDYFTTNEIHQSDYLFQNKSGKHYTQKSIYNQLMKMIKRADVPSGITPHSFRKACATNLYIRTKDLLFVRDYLNHKDAKVTQTYIDRATLSQINRRIH